MEELVPQFEPLSSRSYILVFKVDYQDNYFLNIDIRYSSQAFTDQLNRQLRPEDAMHQDLLHTEDYDIDWQKRLVVRRLQKIYKFEATLPFEVRK